MLRPEPYAFSMLDKHFTSELQLQLQNNLLV